MIVPVIKISKQAILLIFLVKIFKTLSCVQKINACHVLSYFLIDFPRGWDFFNSLNCFEKPDKGIIQNRAAFAFYLHKLVNCVWPRNCSCETRC